MEERYELVEARGNDGEIQHAEIAIIFDQDGKTVVNRCGGPLPASVPSDSPAEVVIQSALNALGARKLMEIRDEARNKLLSAEHDLTVYFSTRDHEVERVYLRIALLEIDRWHEFKRYFEHASPWAVAMFEDAPTWRKENPDIQAALFNDVHVLDQIFQRAYELAREAEHSNIFQPR